MFHRIRTATVIAAIGALTVLTACAPPANDEDALPGSDSNVAAKDTKKVDVSAISPLVSPVPSCKDYADAFGSLIADLQPKPSAFEKRSQSGGAEVVTCNYVNKEYVAKADGAATLTFEIRAAKISAESYEADKSATDLIIAGSPAEADGGKAFAVGTAAAPTSTLGKDGVISVFDGLAVLTTLNAPKGSTFEPTVTQVLEVQDAVYKQLKG